MVFCLWSCVSWGNCGFGLFVLGVMRIGAAGKNRCLSDKKVKKNHKILLTNHIYIMDIRVKEK